MSDPTPDADISALSFEQALEQLERIVSELESGQAPLERSIDIYERGARLKAHCEARLPAARLRVAKIVVGPGGAAVRAAPAGPYSSAGSRPSHHWPLPSALVRLPS